MAGFAVRSEHSEHSEHRICGQVCTRHLASLHQQVQHLRILQQQVRNAAKSPEVPVFSPCPCLILPHPPTPQVQQLQTQQLAQQAQAFQDIRIRLATAKKRPYSRVSRGSII